MTSDEKATITELERLNYGMEPVPDKLATRELIITQFVDALGFPHLRAEMIAWVDNIMTRMLKNSEPGDELWVCRSRYIGPLAGHEGLGIVRKGDVIKFERVKNY